jgi:4'-phosphopantetheinyl transferase
MFPSNQIKTPNSLELYYGNVSEFSIEALIDLLSPLEYQKAESFRKEEDRCLFIVSRAILKLILAKKLEQSVDTIELKYEINGKPYLDNKSEFDIQFNLSHAGNTFLIGITNGADIGVDMEAVDRVVDHSKVASILFSERELKAFNDLKEHEKQLAFLKYWTCKEAFLKAKGVGLTFPVHELELGFLEKDEVKIVGTHWDDLEKEQWHLKSFQIANKYQCAVAVNAVFSKSAMFELTKIDYIHTLLKC